MNKYMKNLVWFQKTTTDDGVKVNYSISIPDVGIMYKDDTVSDLELCRLAELKGKTTWDEEEICDVFGLEYPIVTPVVVQQENVDTALDTEIEM